jgi:hypothetical protein
LAENRPFKPLFFRKASKYSQRALRNKGSGVRRAEPEKQIKLSVFQRKMKIPEKIICQILYCRRFKTFKYFLQKFLVSKFRSIIYNHFNLHEVIQNKQRMHLCLSVPQREAAAL